MELAFAPSLGWDDVIICWRGHKIYEMRRFELEVEYIFVVSLSRLLGVSMVDFASFAMSECNFGAVKHNRGLLISSTVITIISM